MSYAFGLLLRITCKLQISCLLIRFMTSQYVLSGRERVYEREKRPPFILWLLNGIIRLKWIMWLKRKSRRNAYEIRILSFIIVLHFAVVFMRWWWPPSRVNGLRRCVPLGPIFESHSGYIKKCSFPEHLEAILRPCVLHKNITHLQPSVAILNRNYFSTYTKVSHLRSSLYCRRHWLGG